MEQPTPYQFQLWTDGSVSANKNASAACIVKEINLKTRLKVVGLINQCPPSEAELLGGILGLTIITQLCPKGAQVEWHCDNLPVLQGATVYLEKWQKHNWTKNDNSKVNSKLLWETFTILTKDIDLRAEHSPGHSGIPENETCDKACRWVSQDGEKLLKKFGESRIGRQAILNPQQAWTLFDLREIIKEVKSSHQAEKLYTLLTLKLKGFLISHPDKKLFPALRETIES